MIQPLKNDKNSMITVHFEGGNSFYNISHSEYNMRWDNMMLRLGLLHIYIGGKGYSYNERVEWRVQANIQL